MFHDAHQSGKFNANINERRTMNVQLAKNAEIHAATEQAGLKFLVKGWMSAGDETQIRWNHDRWRLYGHGVKHIATVRYKRGTDYRENVPVTFAALELRRTGLLLLRFAAHPPAHLYVRANRRANQQFLDGLEKAIAPLIRQFKPDEVTGSADFNRHLGLERNRRIVAKAVHNLGLHVLVPPKATHGPIFKIDGFVTNAPGTLSMLDRVRGYDHRGIRRMSLSHGKD